MILAVKSKLAVSLVKAIVFPFVGVYLTVMCVPYTQVFRNGGGVGGGGALTRVSINFDPRKKISHP